MLAQINNTVLQLLCISSSYVGVSFGSRCDVGNAIMDLGMSFLEMVLRRACQDFEYSVTPCDLFLKQVK